MGSHRTCLRPLTPPQVSEILPSDCVTRWFLPFHGQAVFQYIMTTACLSIPGGGCLGCFWSGVAVNKATVGIHVQLAVRTRVLILSGKCLQEEFLGHR